jgi:hypothetical protein
MAFNAKSSVIDALAATGNDDTDIGGKENLVKMLLVIGEEHLQWMLPLATERTSP